MGISLHGGTSPVNDSEGEDEFRIIGTDAPRSSSRIARGLDFHGGYSGIRH
jgi:hypothetical protein